MGVVARFTQVHEGKRWPKKKIFFADMSERGGGSTYPLSATKMGVRFYFLEPITEMGDLIYITIN